MNKKAPILAASLLGAAVLLLSSQPAWCSFSDNFEDGDLAGWYTNGPGTINVENQSSSKWAHLYQGSYGYSIGYSDTRLGHLLNYASDLQFDFEMKVSVFKNSERADAYGGVFFDFLDGFNSSLGKVGLIASTNQGTFSSSPELVKIATDSVLPFSLNVNNLLTKAGVTSSSDVKKINMYFQTSSVYGFYSGNQTAYAHVWLDNINVTSGGNAVVTPEPASMALFGLGGAVMAFARRRKQNV